MRYVLFVCTHNAGRSLIAEAFFNRHAPADVRAESAGDLPRPEGAWPTVVQAMQEVGIDLSGRRPRRVGLEMQLHADWGITLACGASCPYVPSRVEDWDIADPGDQPIEVVRKIRDEIEDRILDFIKHRLHDVRTDRTAHELRLKRLLPMLAEEFEATRSPEEIRQCADAVLEEFTDVPVRSHVLTLAHRQTRECLTAEHCYALSA